MSVKRASYTLQFKMEVVQWIDSTGSSLRAASKRFNVDRKMLRNWLADKDKMKVALLVHGPGMRKVHEGRSPVSQELDKLVLEQYLSVKDKGDEMCTKEIKTAALKCAKVLGLKDFKATTSWVHRWKARCSLEPRQQGGMGIGNETVATLLQMASTLLSQTKPSDAVDLSGERIGQSEHFVKSCDEASVEGECLDYCTPEHNYCKPYRENSELDHVTSLSRDQVSCILDSHVTSEELSCDPRPALECEVAELDLPLGQEVEVYNELLTNCSDVNARSTSPPFFPPLTFDPHSHGGLLASRMLQPVFPDEPEIVYLDMQLGMLHSMH